MITEIVLWKMPKGMSRNDIINKFRASVPTWQANPNLIRKAFLFDEKSRRGGGVYLWKTSRPRNLRTDQHLKIASMQFLATGPIFNISIRQS
jgi:hypothetical protein